MPKPNRPNTIDRNDSSSSKLNRLRTCLQNVADVLEAAIAEGNAEAKGVKLKPVSAGGDMLLRLAALSETVKSACRWLWELDHGPDAKALWECWIDLEADMGQALAVLLAKNGTPKELIAEIHKGPIPSEKLHGVLHRSIRGAAMHMHRLVQTLRRDLEALGVPREGHSGEPGNTADDRRRGRKQRYSLQEDQALVDAWKKSKLTQKEYEAENKLKHGAIRAAKDRIYRRGHQLTAPKSCSS